MKKLNLYHSAIIDAFGGTSKLAKICRIDPAAVCQWRTNGIPEYRMDYFKLLRPDIFVDVAQENFK